MWWNRGYFAPSSDLYKHYTNQAIRVGFFIPVFVDLWEAYFVKVMDFGLPSNHVSREFCRFLPFFKKAFYGRKLFKISRIVFLWTLSYDKVN